MKNIIPIIVSVALGLAAVYVVSRLLFDKEQVDVEPKVAIVVAARDLESHDELQQGSLTYKDIPQSAIPRNALLWENVSLAYGQQIPRGISRGDFILISDIKISTTLADCAKAGEWTIPVTFSDPALVKMLSPDDEIAIVCTYTTKKVVPAKVVAVGQNQAFDVETSRETSVLLPRVRVIGVSNEKGSFRESGTSSGTIFVSLPPQQAMILIAAQRESELYPVLRKNSDSAALNRKDAGVVNSETFSNMRKGLGTVALPEVPNK